MSKLLEIVITHWTEPWEIVRPGIMMLSVQRRVDWENIGVTIIHDGTDVFPKELLVGLPFEVNQITIPHCGISAARNYAIDHSDATWIKFCDCDDTFAGVYSLSCIMDILLTSTQYDMLWFPFVFDRYYGTQIVLDGSPVFIHDKVLRRSFLIKKNIRFNENLVFSEDFAFVSLIKMTLDNSRVGKVESNFPIYVYVQRMNGIANREDMWLKNRIGLFDAHRYVEKELMNHGSEHESHCMVGRAISEACAAMTTDAPPIDMSLFVDLVAEYYNDNKDRLDEITEDDWDFIINVTNQQNNSNLTKKELDVWIENNLKGTANEREDQ